MALSKIVNLHATWCAPCKAFESTFNNVANNDSFKNIKFERLNIEEDEGMLYAEKFHVKTIPTTILLDENDEQIVKISGNVPEVDFINVIQRNL